MPSKKSLSTRPAAKIAGSSGLAASSATLKQLNQSSIIRHAFAPSQLQLNLFASVVQGINSEVLRLHDTLTGKLQTDYSLGNGKVSCLDWGYYGTDAREQRPLKKRKTKTGQADQQQALGDAVIAIGAHNSPNIEVYSPVRKEVVAVLQGGHTGDIIDFRFLRADSQNRAWSLGGDGKLVEWSMADGSVIRSIQVATESGDLCLVYPLLSQVLYASSSIFSIDPQQPDEIQKYSAFTANVQTIAVHSVRQGSSQTDMILGSARTESTIYAFDRVSAQIRGQLLASDAVADFRITQSSQQPALLVAVTENGSVELFESPCDFHVPDAKTSKSAKAARKAMVKRPKSTIQITRPGKPDERVPILSVEFEGNSIVLGWVEGTAHPCFERIQWRTDSGSLILDGSITIEKAKSAAVTTNAHTNGLELGKAHVNDSETIIAKGGDVDVDGMDVDSPEDVDAGSASDDSSDDGADDEEEDGETNTKQNKITGQKRRAAERIVNGNTDDGSGSDEAPEAEAEEPSFGEQLRAKANDTVDVFATFPTKAQSALVPQGAKSMSLPAGMSLGTVLAQSLRTNDRDLLETCFHVHDLKMIRATIERLDSNLAGSLLERLAERLHNRPGRAGSLIVWIQWTLVAHGGYLATQSKVVNQLRQLHTVVRERAQALQPLLQLKGKLDMLEAQMQLRKNILERSRQLQSARQDEEEDALYIEGQEEIDSGDEVEVSGRLAAAAASGEEPADIEFDSDDDEDLQAGLEEEDEDEDDEDEDSEADGGFVDDEAEEGTDSEVSGEEVDYDDVDALEVDDEDDDDEAESDADEVMVKASSSRPKVNGIVRKRKS